MVVIADKQGIFKKNGLDVTTQVVSDISKIPPTLGNQYDIGFGVEPLVIRGASQGLKTLAIAGNIESSASAPSVAMVAKPDSGIAGPKDMAGKTLAVANLTGNLYLGAAYWIDRGGVDLKFRRAWSTAPCSRNRS
jgi:NitT/TauT family transport system substrate-binding protein